MLCAALLGIVAALPVTVDGRVFADLDRDGAFSAGDTPLGGVAVVWESSVWTTSRADGTFRFLVPGPGIVWASAPDGFEPGPWWRDLPADGGAVELGLRPSAARGPVRFVQASDTHLGAAGYFGADDGVSPRAAAEALAQATALDPPAHFVTITGDLTADASPDAYDGVLALTRGLPFVPVIGNHDVPYGDESPYRARFGPPSYSFTLGGAHFVVLDYTQPAERIDAFLAADEASAPPGLPLVALTHAPMPAWAEVYARHGVDWVISGHVHSNRIIDWGAFVEVNTEPLVMGGIDGSPAGFRILTLDGAGFRVEHHTVVDGTAPFLAAVHPLPGGCVPDDDLVLLAAAEAGTRFRSLTVAVDGAAPVPLEPAGGWVHRARVTLPPGRARHQAVIMLGLAGGKTVDRVIPFCRAEPLPSPDPIEDWPQLGGDARHSGWTEATIRPPLAVLWTRELGGHARGGSPIVAAGRLFVPVVDPADDTRGGLVALDARTGETLWERRGASVHGAPAAADGLVVIASIDGKLRALDAATGADVWQADLQEGLAPMDGWLYAGPTVSGGVVYAGHRLRFEARELASGRRLWQAAPAPALALPGAHAQAAVDGELVVAAFGRVALGVVGLDTATGEVRWRLDGPPSYASPILGERLFLGGSDTLVRGVEPASGAVRWATKLVAPVNDWSSGMSGTGALAGGRLYLPTMWGSFFAVDADEGRVAWRLDAEPSVLHTNHYQARARAFAAAPAVTGELVWIGGADGKLRAVGAKDGHERWQLDLGVPILSGVVPAGAALYVATWDGTVRALVPVAAASVDLPEGCGCRIGGVGAGAPTLFLGIFLLLCWRRRR